MVCSLNVCLKSLIHLLIHIKISNMLNSEVQIFQIKCFCYNICIYTKENVFSTHRWSERAEKPSIWILLTKTTVYLTQQRVKTTQYFWLKQTRLIYNLTFGFVPFWPKAGLKITQHYLKCTLQKWWVLFNQCLVKKRQTHHSG